MYDVALIGAGNMGGAMLKGWIDTGTVDSARVVIFDKDTDKSAALRERYGIAVAGSCIEAAAGAGTVVLAVKPQDIEIVLDEINGSLEAESVLLSIVAGLSISSIRERVGGDPGLLRVMPNMGALVGASVSGYTVDRGAGCSEPESRLDLLRAVGEVVEVEESLMDLVTAVSGSGPAYFFMLVEVLEKVAIEHGMSPETAKLLAEETIWGAAKVLKESGRSAGELREAVSSPGGTTLAALSVFVEHGFHEMVSRAVNAARKRAAELTS